MAKDHIGFESLAVIISIKEKKHANYAPFLDNQQSWMMQLLVSAWDQTIQAQDMLNTFYKDS